MLDRQILFKIGDLVKLLTNFEKIVIGRENFYKIDFEDDLILMDILHEENLGRMKKYSKKEVMTFQILKVAYLILDFYGSHASDLVNKFTTNLDNQICNDFCFKENIEVFYNKDVKYLKYFEGVKSHNKVQVELKIKYYQILNVDVLNIESLQNKFITN